jgi:hypothetical protein
LFDICQHEIECQQSVCSNELCAIDLELMHNTSKVKFNINGDSFVSCSKKCKKVTKFAYMIRKNNEEEILRAFESMLRKKIKKQAVK